MSSELTVWLVAHDGLLCEAVAQRAPTLLIEEADVLAFVSLVADAAPQGGSGQLAAVQSWAHRAIGADTQLAKDWITLLRIMKDLLGGWLARDFPEQMAFAYWRALDRVFTHALVEAAMLAGDSGHSTMLAYMEDLKRQVTALELSKTSFVTVAAHELRTPLTILEGYANMLRGRIPPEEQQLHLLLDGMGNGIRRLKEIISDMIDVTMIDSHALTISFQPLLLDRIVRMAAENLAEAFRERNVRLDVFTIPIEHPIYGDPSRLFQALSRLLGNSLKYTPDGGSVQVSGRLTRQDEAYGGMRGYVEILIEDAGIGIAREQLETIFEKFGGSRDVGRHSSGRTKFKGGGPGLGLPIVRGIIEAHGGRVWAESPGLDESACPGSVFHVELPIRVRPPAT